MGRVRFCSGRPSFNSVVASTSSPTNRSSRTNMKLQEDERTRQLRGVEQEAKERLRACIPLLSYQFVDLARGSQSAPGIAQRALKQIEPKSFCQDRSRVRRQRQTRGQCRTPCRQTAQTSPLASSLRLLSRPPASQQHTRGQYRALPRECRGDSSVCSTRETPRRRPTRRAARAAVWCAHPLVLSGTHTRGSTPRPPTPVPYTARQYRARPFGRIA